MVVSVIATLWKCTLKKPFIRRIEQVVQSVKVSTVSFVKTHYFLFTHIKQSGSPFCYTKNKNIFSASCYLNRQRAVCIYCAWGCDHYSITVQQTFCQAFCEIFSFISPPVFHRRLCSTNAASLWGSAPPKSKYTSKTPNSSSASNPKCKLPELLFSSSTESPSTVPYSTHFYFASATSAISTCFS